MPLWEPGGVLLMGECGMRNRARKRQEGEGKIGRGETVVIEDSLGVLLTEDFLDTILAMAELAKKPAPKK